MSLQKQQQKKDLGLNKKGKFTGIIFMLHCMLGVLYYAGTFDCHHCWDSYNDFDVSDLNYG